MLTTLTKATPEALAEIAEEMQVRQTKSVVLLFSMGSQFDHLIYQKVAKCGVFCLLADPAQVTAEDVKRVRPKGIIVSGGPASMHAEPPPFDNHIFDLGIPVLGICLGFQMWAKHLGAEVRPSEIRELQVVNLELNRRGSNSTLFAGVSLRSEVLQTHGDIVYDPAERDLTSLASTKHSPIAAARCTSLWGVQFHPEVSDTTEGDLIFENFLGRICEITDRFPAEDVLARKLDGLYKQTRDKRGVVLLSGGSDSSVTAELLMHVMDDRMRLKGIYIKGVDRADDEANVLKHFGNHPKIQLEVVDATELFLTALAGKVEPRDKRVAMRGVYKEVAEEKIAEFGADFIAQGTLYTDLVESGHGHQTGARRAQIKLHHNVNLGFSVPEVMPLADMVKDNARGLGRQLGVDEELLTRHPFPGPGLLIRNEGEMTRERLKLTREADGIVMQELRQAGLYEKIWQAGARVTSSRHTKTAGDDAESGWVVVWFAFSSVNGFTARSYDVPKEIRNRIASRMGNEVLGVGQVAYNDSDKPPSTIEAE